MERNTKRNNRNQKRGKDPQDANKPATAQRTNIQQNPTSKVPQHTTNQDLSAREIFFQELPVVTARQIRSFAQERTGKVKIHKQDVPFDKSIRLEDISPVRRVENDFFLANQENRERIRRGLTILYLYTTQSQEKHHETIIGRKGLQKFFDLRYQHIMFYQNNLDLKSLKKDHKSEDRSILALVKLCMMKLKQDITVYQTGKANGENCSISAVFIPSSNKHYWLISSKNVSILASDTKEIQQYSEKSIDQPQRNDGSDNDRFYFARLMAWAWFNHLDQLRQLPDGESQIQKLLFFCLNHTLIGEYCGNQNLQHLVHYDSCFIQFYAIVNKHSNEACLPLKRSFAIFDNFKLKAVTLKEHPKATNFVQLVEFLQKLQLQMLSSSVEKEGEGNVIYFEASDPKEPEKERFVVTCAKLKTLEYWIFRKIREKLKLICPSKGAKRASASQLSQTYAKEIGVLCRNVPLPRPMKEYTELATGMTSITVHQIQNRFLDILKLYQYHYKAKSINSISQNDLSELLNRKYDPKYDQLKSRHPSPNINSSNQKFPLQMISEEDELNSPLKKQLQFPNTVNLNQELDQPYKMVFKQSTPPSNQQINKSQNIEEIKVQKIKPGDQNLSIPFPQSLNDKLYQSPCKGIIKPLGSSSRKQSENINNIQDSSETHSRRSRKVSFNQELDGNDTHLNNHLTQTQEKMSRNIDTSLFSDPSSNNLSGEHQQKGYSFGVSKQIAQRKASFKTEVQGVIFFVPAGLIDHLEWQQIVLDCGWIYQTKLDPVHRQGKQKVCYIVPPLNRLPKWVDPSQYFFLQVKGNEEDIVYHCQLNLGMKKSKAKRNEFEMKCKYFKEMVSRNESLQQKKLYEYFKDMQSLKSRLRDDIQYVKDHYADQTLQLWQEAPIEFLVNGDIHLPNTKLALEKMMIVYEED